jgi:hypothetical protein
LPNSSPIYPIVGVFGGVSRCYRTDPLDIGSFQSSPSDSLNENSFGPFREYLRFGFRLFILQMQGPATSGAGLHGSNPSDLLYTIENGFNGWAVASQNSRSTPTDVLSQHAGGSRGLPAPFHFPDSLQIRTDPYTSWGSTNCLPADPTLAGLATFTHPLGYSLLSLSRTLPVREEGCFVRVFAGLMRASRISGDRRGVHGR